MHEEIKEEDKEKFIAWFFCQYPEFVKTEYYRWKNLHKDKRMTGGKKD